MDNRKKKAYKLKTTIQEKRNIIPRFLKKYDIETAEEI